MNEKKLRNELENSLRWASDGGFSRKGEAETRQIQDRLISAYQRVHGADLRTASIAVGNAFERGKQWR